MTCQPKCQIAVCGSVAGGWSTLVNSTSTLFGDFSAVMPPQVVFDVLGNAFAYNADRRLGVHRVQVEMMEARRRQRGRLRGDASPDRRPAPAASSKAFIRIVYFLSSSYTAWMDALRRSFL